MADAMHGLGFHLEKIPGRGEDAKPVWGEDGTGGWVAVFDGLGGAGAAVVESSGATQAAIAGRLARDVVRSVCATTGGRPEAGVLAGKLDERFRGEREILGLTEGRVRSRLIKMLPTTVALATRRLQDDRLVCTAIWAGDSRVYVLTPTAGLQQLSTDDIVGGGDAWQNLRDDARLSNMVSASAPVTLRSRAVEIGTAEPAVLIAATDGCFGYLQTPMHFEALLLGHLGEAENYEAWLTGIAHTVSEVTGDDATLEMVTGRAPLVELREGFTKRAEWLRGQLAELDSLRDQTSREEYEKREAEHWQEYKTGYEALLAEPPVVVVAQPGPDGAL